MHGQRLSPGEESLARNEPQFFQLKKRWSNVLRLGLKYVAVVVRKNQALDTVLSFTRVPPQCHSVLRTFLEDDSEPALPSSFAGFYQI